MFSLVKFTLAAALLFGAAAAMGDDIDGVAAQVDATTILKSDVLREMRRAGEGRNPTYEETRDALVERALILKAATAAKMTVQDWVVENRVREIIKHGFGDDRSALLSALEREKMSYAQWHTRIREDLIVSAMRWNAIDKNATVSPAALRAEYAAHPERYAAKPTVTVSVILLKPEDASLCETVSREIATNSFAAVARARSADSHAGEGGLWKDVVAEDSFRPEVCAAIGRLADGETSPWVSLDGWNFLIRRESAAASRTKSFAEAYEELSASVREAETKRLYDEWIARLKASSFVKVY